MRTAKNSTGSTGNTLGFSAAAAAAALLVAGTAVSADESDSDLLTQARALFKPLPKDMGTSDNPVSEDRVALGRRLFFDPRPSLDGTVSCSRCHQPALYGTDALKLPRGAEDRLNPRNAPTVLNAALQFVQHWRGDRKSVEDQATQALVGHVSFGNADYASAMGKLDAVGYRPLFAAVFPEDKDPLTPENWGKAIGAYERTLVTPAPFDAYLLGQPDALTAEQKQGLRKFIGFGCAGCHSGTLVGGTMYQKFGLVKPYWTATGSKQVDKGRFDVTHDESDLYSFKVPSLRNVAMTPPYFHDGSAEALPEAVRIMAEVQLARKLEDDDVRQLVAFLNSLTGKVPEQYAVAPVLPPAQFPGRGR
ncbi:MAG TPA: cytochrome c peroxidase [Burkholderiales bacterium]|nr:cytochrome c peroxidase [Burkholderiales bacterium]